MAWAERDPENSYGEQIFLIDKKNENSLEANKVKQQYDRQLKSIDGSYRTYFEDNLFKVARPADNKAISNKLVNLRPPGDIFSHDKMGPWYHIFGVMFLGSVSIWKYTARTWAYAEKIFRRVGFTDTNSPKDPFKEDITIAAAIEMEKLVKCLKDADNPDIGCENCNNFIDYASLKKTQFSICTYGFIDNNFKKQGPYIVYYGAPDKIRYMGCYRDDMKDGLWESFDMDGKIRRRSFFSMHKKIWEEEYYSSEWFKGDEPPIRIRYNFLDDVQDGLQEEWYNTGEKRSETYWKNGIHDGPYISWYPNEQISCVGNYSNGEKNGKWVEYLEDGRKSEGEYLNGMKNGHWIESWLNGTKSEGNYFNGKRNGYWIKYWKNGQKQSEGNYSNGEQSGEWIYYSSYGKIENKIIQN
ncbi:MAG: toxin-antitoxin system YwqK family antitoxin [Kosmotogaceae bacterium]